MPQVITIHSDGTASGLQPKQGRGLDLRALGPVDIQRTSDIVWNADAQAWEIEVLRGPFAGKRITSTMYYRATGDTQPATAYPAKAASDTLRFRDYDAAVQAEVAFLDGMRVKGQF